MRKADKDKWGFALQVLGVIAVCWLVLQGLGALYVFWLMNAFQ